ncbi:MAG: flagellar hook-basal body complex protein, partial [Helicobacter sp.]|nr:flagellar hook-basal body complex protein [Helicobacter sp.]
MVGALYNGLSGIKTQQFGIDVTANNISNINTTGFRENNPGFQSLFATSLNGVNASSPIFNDYNYGVKVGSNAINAKDGAYINADGDFNVAYSGRGWFVVGKNKEGSFDLKTPTTGYRQNYFTRDGTFSLDGEGYLVNSAGYYMYGINLQKIAADGSLKASNNLQEDYQKLAGSSLSPIRIPQNLTYSPVLTTEVQLAINVNRTQNGKPISVLSDAKGKFDLDKFLNQDINTFMDSSSTPIDARNFKDIVISLKKGSVLTDYTFTYGKEGDNSFTTVAELVKLVKDQTGLDLSLELNDEDHPADCTLMLSNNTIQNMQISIKGKLADKLNLKTTKQSLESSIDGVLKDFKENEDYKEGDYVKYKGLVFMKNNNDPAEKNPLEDEESWTLVDSTRVLEYN